MEQARVKKFITVITAIFVCAVVFGNTANGDNHVLEVSNFPDSAVIPHHESLTPADSLTIECWVQANQPPGSWGRPISKRPSWWGQYSMNITNEAGAKCYSSGYEIHSICKDGDGGGLGGSFGSEAVCEGVWTHLAIVVNRELGETATYVNGELISAFQFDPSCTFREGSWDLSFGNTGCCSETQFTGRIDNVRIWNVALDLQQINYWMLRNLTPEMAKKLPELGGSWDFEDGISDATGVNNGTLQGEALLVVDNTVFTDCNDNGVTDSEDIIDGTSPDVNPMDGIPDDCQGIPIGGCCVGSHCVVTNINACTSSDGTYLGDSVLCGEAKCPDYCEADLDGDGIVSVNDIILLIAAWGACP